MMLKDVTVLLGAESPYAFITAPQWVKVRHDVRLYHNDTLINVKVLNRDFWFMGMKGIELRHIRLTPDIANGLRIHPVDANALLGISNIIDKHDLKDNVIDNDGVKMDSTETIFTDNNIKNMAYAMGMFAVATATVMGVKTVVQTTTKGRGK